MAHEDSQKVGANIPEDSEEQDRTEKKRKADEEHPERSEGPKWKAEDEDEESRLKKTIKYLKTRGSQKLKSTRKIQTRRKQVKCELKKENRSWILFNRDMGRA